VLEKLYDEVAYVLKVSKLLKEDRGVEIVLQGRGELLGYVKNKVKDMGIKILSREEVAKSLNEADALLLPLKDFKRPYLGISSKLYEYQAVGKPIICCAEGQPTEYIGITNSGVIIKPGNHKSLTEAITKLKMNSKLMKVLGENGRKTVEKEVSIEAIGLKIMEIFEKLRRTS